MSKAERTRQFIVEKTAPIFNAKGYAGTSMSDMTEATGLTKGSIYGNFADKEEVALAAFEHNWQLVQSIVRAEIGKHKTCEDKLLAIAGVYENIHPTFPEGGCPLLNTAVEADDAHPSLRGKAVTALQGWKKTIIALIESGVTSKEFRADANAEQTALTIIALIEGAIMISRLTGNAKHRKAVLPMVRKIILELK